MKKTKKISQAKRPKETPSSLKSNDKNTHKQLKATISREISFQDTKTLISSSGQSVRYQPNPIQRSSESINHLSQEPTLLQNQVWHPEYQPTAIQRSSESMNHLSQEPTLLQNQVWHPEYQPIAIQRSSESMNHLSQEPTLLQNQVWHPEYQPTAIQWSSESMNQLSQEPTLLQNQVWHPEYQPTAIQRSSESMNQLSQEPTLLQNQVWHPEYQPTALQWSSESMNQLSQEPTLLQNHGWCLPFANEVEYQPNHTENGIQEYVAPQVKTSTLRDQLSQEPTDSLVLNRLPFADAVGYQPNHIENETQEFSAQRAKILRHLLKTAGKQSFTQSDEQEHQQATSKSASSFEINIDLLPIKELLKTITMEEITSLYSEAAETARLMNLPTPKKSPQRL